MNRARWGRFLTLLFRRVKDKARRRTIGPAAGMVIFALVTTIAVFSWETVDYWPLGMDGIKTCSAIMAVGLSSLIAIGIALFALRSIYRSLFALWQASEEVE